LGMPFPMLMRVTDEMLMLRLPRTVEQIVSGPVSAAGRVAAFVLLLLLPGVSGWAQSATPKPVASATPADWDVFAKKGCATCHRVRGMGDGAGGSDLGRIRSGTGFFEIAAAMWNHLPRMRLQARGQGAEWPLLTPQELSNVIALVFTAQHQDVYGDAVVGAGLFVSKGCERCHPARGTNGPVGPPLEELKRSSSPVLLAAAMWNHGAQMGEATGAAGVEGATFAGTELPDIVAYILAAGRDPRGEAAPTVFGVAERGTRLFAEKGCARCHNIGSSGSGRGPSLGPRASGATVTELAGRLWNHGPTLRADLTTPGIRVPRLTGQEMADITAYLHASFYFDRVRGDGRRGERRVQDKGCLRCHTIYNKGGRLAPDFATSNVVSSQVGQVSAMWNHGRQMENLAKRRAVVLPTLTAQELSDITRYLAGLGGGAPVGPPRSK
jgi:cytochrome c2